MTKRSSDIVENHTEQALLYGVSGVVLLLLGILLWVYRGQGYLIGLAGVCLLLGIAGIVYAIFCIIKAKQVTSVTVVCSYCNAKNYLMETPDKDFLCTACHRLVPIANGQPMEVFQVRCGYCEALNYYSAKTEVLLCEQCNREVPISLDDGRVGKQLPKGFAVVDDENFYEIRLTGYDNHHTEELISALQQMLALNRNQVKQMLNEMPVTLLTGIPKKKAEILQAQLAVHGGTADFFPVSQ